MKLQIERMELTKSDLAAETDPPVVQARTPNNNARLTSGRLLARNTFWNLAGSVAPMGVAAVCIPLLIKGLGTDRFGVLTLVWALIGYATLFDLGLGRALTQLVANKLGTGEHHEIPTLVWTSLLLMLLMGLVGTVGALLFAPWLVTHALRVPPAMERETLYSVYLMGLSIPIVISTAALRGLLEAHQRFDLATALRVPMGIFAYAGPLMVLPFSKSLFPVVAVVVAGRTVAWIVHLLLCFKVMPTLRNRIAWHRGAMSPLMRFGGWMTVTNIIGPLMVTLDRFVIGSMLTVSAVAYYATPYEVVSKFWLIPGSLLGVMFPAFSTSFAQDRDRAALLYSRTVKLLLLIVFPLILVTVTLANDGLRLWLGAEFAAHSTRVLQWLAVGVFINCLSAAPFAVVQGIGRPDLTAKLHLLELPVYLAALFYLIKIRGIEGAAIAWTGRVAIDAVVLFVLAQHLLPVRSATKFRTPLLAVATLATFALAIVPGSLLYRGAFIALALPVFALVTWFLVLSPEERHFVKEVPVRL